MNTLKKMKLIAASMVAAAVALSASPGFAADEKPALDPAKAEAAKELIAVTKVKELIEPSLTQVKGMQENMLAQQPNLTEDQKKQAKNVLAASMTEVEDALSWKNLEPMMVRVYASVFTEDELKRLAAHFATPDGQLYVSKQLDLQSAMMGEMSQLMMEVMPKIQAKTQAVIEELKAEQQ